MSTITDTNTVASPFLTVSATAAYLQVPEATLYAWRARSKGPKAVRIGRHLRYRLTDVEAWIAEQDAR